VVIDYRMIADVPHDLDYLRGLDLGKAYNWGSVFSVVDGGWASKGLETQFGNELNIYCQNTLRDRKRRQFSQGIVKKWLPDEKF